MPKYMMALDSGTTSNRCILFDRAGRIVSVAQREFTQYFPQPGWVEHDANEIWATLLGVAVEAMQMAGAAAADIAAIGITNQRETTIVWDKATGEPVHHAIVWQCRRTSEYCDELRARGLTARFREKTGGYGMAAAIRSGISRGVFSNEAGLGSLAVLHGMSEGKGRLRQRQEAQKQGMWAIFEVFFDTIIGCSLTAFLLLCVFPHNLTEKIDSLGGSGAVAAALAARFGNAGGIVTAACMVLFAFATILAWFYIGDQALGWLMRDVPQKRADKICILYHGGYLASVFLGCVSRMEAVWAVSDIFNGLMAVPNLAALVLLGRKVRRPER